MNPEDIRELLDKMEPKQIRKLIQEQNISITKKKVEKSMFFWGKLILIPIFLALIFLVFYIKTDNSIGSQLLIAIFVISLILMIADILLMLQKKSRKSKNQPTY